MALQTFFIHVQKAGKWQAVRTTDNVPRRFAEMWNEMNVSIRDRMAVEVANKAKELAGIAVQAALRREHSQRDAAVREQVLREQTEAAEAARRVSEGEAFGRALAEWLEKGCAIM